MGQEKGNVEVPLTTRIEMEVAKAVELPKLTEIQVPSFLIPPSPIQEDQIKRTLIYDVVVVGAGASGLAATVSSAEEGVKVALVEQEKSFQARGGDNTALNSKLHRTLGIQIEIDEIVRKMMETSGFRADERILRLWAHNSGKVMDWLIDMCEKAGVKTWLVIPDRLDAYTLVVDKWPPSKAPRGWDYRNKPSLIEYPTVHRFGDTPSPNQRLLLSVLENNARALGVDIYYETKALRLEKGTYGNVAAVIAKQKDETYVRFMAKKAIILSTGDYGENRAMVEYYLPEEFAKLQSSRSRLGSAVNGHLMACWIGAQMEPRPHCAMVHTWHAMGTAPFLFVDAYGKRFANEATIANAVAIAYQALRLGGFWIVFDSNWPSYTQRVGPGFLSIWKADEITLKEFQAKIEIGRILQANGLMELAKKMKETTPKLDICTFASTVEMYNRYCSNGLDKDFGKPKEYLFPVNSPPLYAAWTPPPARFLVTMGGLITNDKLQPLDEKGEPILGLYVTGNLVGRRFGVDYPLICPGLSHGMALTTGYLAGKFAAKHA